ncbi:hypothetical protein [Hymenobacter sp. GOD-10R]|uniref:hypothetical protein n=1 Tax=Hymenobacter sp. GOD-10R TaxID=3093922 RepID=UPI002D767006|nr:hypothetical protein [Hymenobacter sp. GOD-10R]WRQ30430.1 hypothetical protein SD425_09170 [Hymenobacter sp. GOD-10R]
MKHLASPRSAVGALLLLVALVGCNSSDNRSPAASSGDTPFAGNSTATDPSAAAQRIAANPNVADSLHLLSPGQAGRLLIRMPEKLLLSRVSAEQLHKITRTVGDSTYPAYEMRDAQQPSAPVTILEMAGSEQKGFRLRRIIITDPQYRTGEGIGVGSPFGVARQAFGLSRVRMTPEGFAAVSRQTRMAWLLDENSLPAKHPSDMATAEIPTATRIKGVILF